MELVYEPGELLNEKELISEFNVSRTPVREVFLQLSKENLVEIVPKIGTYVTRIDVKSVKNAYEIKKNLESLAAELAAKRATEDQINELNALALKMSEYDAVKNYKELIAADQLFHKLTRLYSSNDMLINILEELNNVTERFLRHIKYVVDDPNWYYGSLINIAKSIESRDAEGASLEAQKHTEIFLEKLSKNFFL